MTTSGTVSARLVDRLVTNDAAEYPLPYPGGLYFRASIVEQMPSPLTPLFADLIGPAVTGSIRDLLTHALGPVPEGDIAFPTINGYAYYFYLTRGLVRMTLRTPLAVRALNRPATADRPRRPR